MPATSGFADEGYVVIRRLLTDEHPVSFRAEPVQVAVLLFLSAPDQRSGALRLLPGSHRASIPLHAALPSVATPPSEPLPDDHVLLTDAPG